MNFSYFVTLKFTGLSSTMNGSLTRCDFVTPSISHWENISSLSCSDVPNVAQFISSYPKITYVNHIIAKSLCFMKLLNSWWMMQVFENSNFSLKVQTLSLTINAVSCFP